MQQKHFLGLTASGFHKVAYTEWGDPADPCPVVCVHGLTRNGRDFDFLARALAADGRRVVCPDVVGRGASDRLADPAGYGYPQYCADMAGLIARLGVERVDWVGTSMGGLIGMFLAAARQTPIRRLVMNDIGPFIPAAFIARLRDYVGTPVRLASRAGAEAWTRETYSGFGALADEHWRHLARHGLAEQPDGSLVPAYDPAIAAAFRSGEAADIALWPAWQPVAVPVLVVRGALSDLLSAEVVAGMRESHPTHDVAEHVVADAGHAPALMPDALVAVVTDWLQAKPA